MNPSYQDKPLLNRPGDHEIILEEHKNESIFQYSGEIVRKEKLEEKDEYDQEAEVQQTHSYGCYQDCINTVGNCCGFFRTWAPCICCFCAEYPWQVVKQSQQALLQKFGKYVRTLEPGLHYVNPCTEKIFRVDLKIEIIDLVKQVGK